MQQEGQSSSQKQDQNKEEPIRYGDVFKVTGELAKESIKPRDAALMQSAEARATGQSHKGSAAALMQSAADANERSGLVDQTPPTIATSEGMTVVELVLPGQVIRTEYAAGQPLHYDVQPVPTEHSIAANDAITIGQALQGAAMKTGDEPIDENDARAILAAEKRATGSAATEKGGIGATAQAAAELNPRVEGVGKTTISNLLLGASLDLTADKVVTRDDAYKVLEAECRGSSEGHPRPGGIGEAMKAAANLNERMGAPIPRPLNSSEEEEL